LLCTLVQEEENDDGQKLAEYSFKHFTVKYPERIVTIKEHAASISHGTTGLKVWQASIELSEFVLANKKLLEGQTVLELGAGLGLLGLVAAKEIDLKRIYMSDCHPEVLNILVENIKINFNQSSEQLPDDEPTIRLRMKTDQFELGVLQLPWEDCEELQVFDKCGTPDVLLAADVVYDSSIFEPLLNVVNMIFSKNENLLFILCCTLRDPETLTSFLTLLGR
jgi:protein-lysine N-methyltransferase EEF2KMT